MAVGGMGMLSTSNYAARKFGVRAAMPGWMIFLAAVLRIRFIFIWIRIRILGFPSWNNGSGSDLKFRKYIFFYFFAIINIFFQKGHRVWNKRKKKTPSKRYIYRLDRQQKMPAFENVLWTTNSLSP